jgi:hypothetical protein
MRGMYVGPGGVSASLLRLKTAIAREADFTAAGATTRVQIVAFNPLSGERSAHEWHDVAPGDQLTLPVSSPFTWFTVAVATSSGLHESWATVIRPPDLQGELIAPEKATPGDQINISVSATLPPKLPSVVYCLLLTYDARLEHESPLPKLGKRQYAFIRETGDRLRDGLAPDATHFRPPMLFRSMAVASAAPLGASDAFYAAAAQVKDAVFSPGIAPQEDVAAPPLSVPQTRQDFPELAYLELFQFKGRTERVVPLGDQIGTWRCRAYLISGLDVVELTADVQAEKSLYAELDLPAIVAEGDDIQASVTYHSEEPAEMTITLPGGETVQGMVMGHGSERFPLTGPGEVSVQLSSAGDQDWTTRTVKPPGVQTVTASRLELLRAGDTVSAQRVVVYPDVNLVLTDTIEALLRYPFG